MKIFALHRYHTTNALIYLTLVHYIICFFMLLLCCIDCDILIRDLLKYNLSFSEKITSHIFSYCLYSCKYIIKYFYAVILAYFIPIFTEFLLRKYNVVTNFNEITLTKKQQIITNILISIFIVVGLLITYIVYILFFTIDPETLRYD